MDSLFTMAALRQYNGLRTPMYSYLTATYPNRFQVTAGADAVGYTHQSAVKRHWTHRNASSLITFLAKLLAGEDQKPVSACELNWLVELAIRHGAVKPEERPRIPESEADQRSLYFQLAYPLFGLARTSRKRDCIPGVAARRRNAVVDALSGDPNHGFADELRMAGYAKVFANIVTPSAGAVFAPFYDEISSWGTKEPVATDERVYARADPQRLYLDELTINSGDRRFRIPDDSPLNCASRLRSIEAFGLRSTHLLDRLTCNDSMLDNCVSIHVLLYLAVALAEALVRPPQAWPDRVQIDGVIKVNPIRTIDLEYHALLRPSNPWSFLSEDQAELLAQHMDATGFTSLVARCKRAHEMLPAGSGTDCTNDTLADLNNVESEASASWDDDGA